MSEILLVDDDTDLTTPLAQLLQHQGHQVTVAHEGLQAYRLAQSTSFDLLILDWMLPQMSGLDLCRHLRTAGCRSPILFLTARDTLPNRVEGLDAGADDYLIKPFEFAELSARVRALLRRPALLENPDSRSYNRLQVEDLVLDPENRLALRGSRSIPLSDKETCLLALLMEHPGQVLSHEHIYQHLWPEEMRPSSNVLAAQIRLLRRKIEAGREAPLIHTVYGKGYRLGL